MICIFSTCVDYSTTEVMRWLYYLGKKDVIRINSDDNAEVKIKLTSNGCFIRYKNQDISLCDIESVWYRKGRNWLCDQFFPITSEDRSKFIDYYNKRLYLEETKLSEYIHYIIENSVPSLGSPFNGNLNKLIVLQMAKEIGLKIPEFCVFNYREAAQSFFKSKSNLITKAISDGIYCFDTLESQHGYFSYTEKVSGQIIENIPEVVSPSFIQENIDKKFDLRVFVLEDKSYSMAIISQSDEQTKIDFRKYSEERPTRNVPYILPSEISEKINILFKSLNLKTGSVDLIVDKSDDYYFLEINPVGQFDILSKSCNYFLDKEIALNLIKKSQKSAP